MTVHSMPIQAQRVAYSRLLWVTLLAMLLASLFNSLLYVIGQAIGAFSVSYTIAQMNNMPITLAPVIFATSIGVLGGCLVFALLGLVTQRPVRWYRMVAIGVLVLSFASPLTLPAAPIMLVLFLEAMHVVTGLLALWLPTRLAVQTVQVER